MPRICAHHSVGEPVTVTVILLSRNSKAQLADTVLRTVRTLDALTPSFEIIACDDASTDGSAALLEGLAEQEPRLLVRRRARYGGRWVALREGFAMARGTVVITLDGDGRVGPEQISVLLHGIKNGHDVVSGRRTRRELGLVRRMRSRGARAVLGFFSGLNRRDWGSGFRAYRRHSVSALLSGPELTFMLPDLLDLRGLNSAQVAVSETAPVECDPDPFGTAQLSLTMLRAIAALRVSHLRLRSLPSGGPGHA